LSTKEFYWESGHMDLDLLKALVTVPGLPGWEEPVRRVIKGTDVAARAVDVEEDDLGSLMLDLGGEGERLLLDAHMDEVGFMVRHVDEAGFIRFIPLGGMDAQVVLGQRVVIHAARGQRQIAGVIGQIPPHLSKAGSRPQGAPDMADLYVDTGLEPEVVRDLIRPGDYISFPDVWECNGGAVMARALDDRIGIFVILEALGRLIDSGFRPKGFRLALSFTVQEENGLKGAGPVMERLRPRVAIAVEGTVCNDVPGVPEHKILARAGAGPEIRLSDGRFLADRPLSDLLVDTASKAGIRHQVVVKDVGGTNAGLFQKWASGCRAGALSVPVRYIHGPCGIARIRDIEETIGLLSGFLERAGELFGA
jgi:endoglucanase